MVLIVAALSFDSSTGFSTRWLSEKGPELDGNTRTASTVWRTRKWLPDALMMGCAGYNTRRTWFGRESRAPHNRVQTLLVVRLAVFMPRRPLCFLARARNMNSTGIDRTRTPPQVDLRLALIRVRRAVDQPLIKKKSGLAVIRKSVPL